MTVRIFLEKPFATKRKHDFSSKTEKYGISKRLFFFLTGPQHVLQER